MHSFFSPRSFSFLHLSAAVLLILVQVFNVIPVQAASIPESVQPSSIDLRPLYAPVPSVALNIPSEVFLGEQFKFTATFTNAGDAPGYGPFIDLYFPVTGMDGDDGIDFVSASYGGTTLPAAQVKVNTFPISGFIEHPIAVMPGGTPSDSTKPLYRTVYGTPGDKLVTLILPFGSFVPGQPSASVEVTAKWSNLADVGQPLYIRAAGGYQFGATPTNDFCCSPFDATIYNVPDPQTPSSWPGSPSQPIIMTLEKSYIGPESETATGPNFPRQFRITVDIADGQTVNNLNFVDVLPDNIRFIGIDSVTGGGYTVNGSLPTAAPGGTVDITLTNPVTGTTGSSDAVLLFSFYVDRLDASSNPVINENTGAFANSNNSASASGPWDPIDPRDDTLPLPTASGACTPPCVGFQDQSIAVQKSVDNLTDSNNSPGDVLEYTLQFQISDFFGFEDVVLTDVISDGQRFDTTFTPTLNYSGNPGPTDFNGNFVLNTNYTVDSSDIGNSGPGFPASDGTDGTQTITFNVSGLLGEQVLGGCVNPTQANNPPDCSSYTNGGTIGTIVFRTIIQGDFTDTYPSGDPSVDHGDLLENDVVITGTVLDLADYSPVTGFGPASGTPVDDSAAGVTIAFGGLVKSIYAVNGSTTLPDYLKPGDLVTYRLRYTQPASDFEETVFTDYLPLPVLDADEITTLSNAACGGTYPAGTICLGSGDTFHTTFASVWGTTYIPTLSVSSAGNSFTVTYPEFDDISNQNTVIELMFTVTVQNDPFADGLFLTNQAAAQEGTTNAGDQNVDSIVQIKLGEPFLKTSKTAVSSNHAPDSEIIYTPGIAEIIADQFTAPGNTGVPFTAPISSNELSSDPDNDKLAFNLFNSTMSGADAGDLIKYAILVENRGHSSNGAYDVVISDIKPTEMDFPSGNTANLNLQLYRGDGTPLDFEVVNFGGDGEYGGGDDTVTPGTPANAFRIFDAGYAIRIMDPTSGADAGKGSCQVHDAVSGKNIIVITYDLQVIGQKDPEYTIINTASLHNYGGEEGGPNHLTDPIKESADVKIGRPILEKTLLSTELDSALTPATVTGNAKTQAVIGEIATYELKLKLHEGTLTTTTIEDTLDAGLSFVAIDSVTISSPADVTTQNSIGIGANPANVTIANVNGGVANQLIYNFGNITDTDTDDTVDETITIVYRAVVNNVGANQSGTQLNNSAQLKWVAPAIPPSITPIPDSLSPVESEQVTVIEPSLSITKDTIPSSITNVDAGDIVDYQIVITNNGTTEAYDVTVSDTLPEYYGTPSIQGVSGTGGAASVNFEIVGTGTYPADPYIFRTTAAADIDLNPGETIIIDLRGYLPQTLPPSSVLTNTVYTQWTSLNGNITDRSTHNLPESDERTGSNPVVAPNDYTTSATKVNDIENPLLLTKSLITTSESHTTLNGGTGLEDVAIGEIVRYRLAVRVPEGTSRNLQFQDRLPAGMIFLDDGTARFSFVSDAASPGMITSTLSGSIPALNCANDNGSAPAAATMNCTFGDDNISNSLAGFVDTFNSGTNVYFKFGNIVNSENDANDEYIVVDFNALVDNAIIVGPPSSQNDAGDTLINDFVAHENGSPSPVGVNSNDINVTVREPVINNVDKALTAPVPTSFDAGDTVSFTVTFSNTGSVDAFDAILRDTLHPALDLTSVSAPTYTTCSTTPVATNNSDTGAGNLVQYTFDRVAPNCQISLTYTASILYSVTPMQVLTNTGVVTYTSLPGTNGTTTNPTGSSTPGNSGDATGERNGTNPIVQPNDYMDTDNAQFTIDNVVPTKSITATSETTTSGAGTLNGTPGNVPNVAIGEIMRYRLTVQVPEGSNTDLILTDQLSTGVTPIFDTTTEISTLNFGSSFTSVDFGAPLEAASTGTVDLHNGAGFVFTAPFNLVTLNGSNLLTFNLGDIVNNDSDANAEYIIIDFNVLVDNESGIDNADVLANNFGVSVNLRPVVTSNTVNARVVEPSITNLDKTVTSTGPYDAGDTVNYQVTYTNAGTSDAFEARVLDALNSTYFTLNTGSVSVASVCATLPATVVTTSNTVDVTVSRVPVGCAVTITYSAVLTTAVNPSTNYNNTANITYTSLPGTGTTGNPTGSNTPGGSGALNGERDGSGGLVNDHNDTDNAQITITAIQPEKRIIATSETHTFDPVNPTNILVDDISTNPRPVVVGEVMRYQLAMTVPEGTSIDFIIADQLSTGVTPIFDATTEIRTLNFGAPFTSVDFGPALAAASTGTVDLYNAGGAPQFTAPFNLVTLNGSNLLTFNLGDIVNNDLNDGNVEYIIIEFNVVVDNEAGNQNLTVFDNDFTVSINGTTSGTSNTVYHRVVEPILATSKNDNDPDGWAYGQTVTYTVQLSHVSGNPTPANNSAADAFDLVVTDTIPAGLTYVPSSMTAPVGWTTDQTAAPTLTWRCTSPACAMTLAGGVVNLTYQVIVNDVTVTPHIDGNNTVTNTAVTTWTSLPGTGTTGNPTGSNTPGGSGATNGERNGTNPIVQPNDYTVSANHTDGLTPYYALGNRVWFDTDNSATINGAEVGVSGVQVRLYEVDGVTPVLGTDGITPRVTTTNATGYYLFDYLEPRDYVVVIPAANFDNTGVGDTTTALVGYWSSQTSRNASGVIIETAAPDPDNNTDLDDNGTRQASGDVVSLPITIGPGEPIGEVAPGGQGAQPDNRANMTVDFGFYKVAIGNLVYEDINANGTYDSGTDTPLNGVTVQLLSSNGTLIETTFTSGGGNYSFVNHPDGDYIVRVTTPADMVSTIDTFAASDTTDPDNGATGEVDDNDNGIGIGADTLVNVSSGVLTMDSGETGSTPTVIVVDNNTGTTTDNGLDFGFVYPYALGNRVWFDTDNSADINGVEVGVDGVLVTLYHADALGVATTPVLVGGLPVSDTTANGGYYLFDYLNPGNYVVVLPASNFAVGAVLEGYWSSQTNRDNTTGAITEIPAPDPDLGVDGAVGGGDDDEDSDDNGTLQTSGTFTGAVIAQAITLGPSGNTEPTNDDDLEVGVNHGDQPDGRSNLSVDFGFYKVSVGNLVWADADKDGVYDSGEPLFQNATVYLYAANPATNVVIGAALTSTTTDINGVYHFDNLPEGNYIVAVDAPVGTFSTIDSADTTTPNANTDDEDNGIGQTGGTVYSNAVFLEAGNPGINNIVDDGAGPLTIDFGTTHNPTMDFGFTPVYSLGNRVWYDTNNNRIIDNGEVGVNGVTVHLYDTLGNEILVGPDGVLGVGVDDASGVVTANGGYYLFNGLEKGDYVVVIPAENFNNTGGGDTTTALVGYWSSETRRDTNTGLIIEPLAHSPETSQDSDDNGTLQTSGAFNGGVISQPVTLGPTFNEPQNEGLVAGALDATLPGNQQGQPDAQANMTVDFGFYTITLGDLIWVDSDNSGTVTGVEAGINGVTVHLYPVNGVGAPVGSPVIATTAGGGLYTYTGLPQGNYIVRLPDTNFMGSAALRDYYSSTGAGNIYEPAPNPDAVTVNSDDNGSEVGTLGYTGGYIQSSVFSLTPGAEDAPSSNNSLGLTSEPRVDFGVRRDPQVNLSIVKTETPAKGYYLQGETTTYTIVVTNHGPADVTGAVINDAMPLDGSYNPMFSDWDWACTTTGSATCTPQSNLTGNFTDTVNMPIGSTITYTVSATVSATATGTLVNTATVTSPITVTEGTLTDNSSSDTNLPASLTVTKTDGLSVVAPNTLLTYTITISNNGAVDLTKITVTDTLPATEMIFQSANPAPTTAPAPNTPGGTLTWTGLSLTAGSSMTITVTAQVIPTAVGPNLVNSVTVTDGNTNATTTTTDTDVIAWDKTKVLTGTSETFTPETIVAPATARSVAIGEILTYQISVEVPPNSTLTNLKALDIMDAGLSFVRCVSITPHADLTTDLTGGFPAVCNAPVNPAISLTQNPTIAREPVGDPNAYNDGRRVDFTLGNVTNTSLTDVRTLTITYEAIVLDIPTNVNGAPALDNRVTWSWLGGTLSASATPVEIKEPQISIGKNADPLIAQLGSTITFTISIAHTSTSTIDAFDVIVTDDLPAGLELVPGTISFTGLPADTTTYDSTNGLLTFTWNQFGLTATSTITFQATFVGPAPVINSANVQWTSLPIDPQPNGQPVLLSIFNNYATERWYDPADLIGLNSYGSTASVVLNVPSGGKWLPKTGFAPDVVTDLPPMPDDFAYAQTTVTIEIPKLNQKLTLVGVPFNNETGEWDLRWLGGDAGWLENTAFPTHSGNSAITAHTTLSNGMDGPFAKLDTLNYGDQIIVHIDGQRYIYEVRTKLQVRPDAVSTVLKHEEISWLTLITCKSYNETTGEYAYRSVIRAVLLKVEDQ